MYRNLQFGIIDTLNPKEKDSFAVVYAGLQALGYISVDSDGNFIRLTAKGYDYIYDDEAVKVTNSLPWIIPPYSNTNWDIAYNRLWKIIGPQNEARFYLGGPKYLDYVCRLDDSICSSYGMYIEERKNKGLSTSRVTYYKELLMSLEESKRYELFVNIQADMEKDAQDSIRETKTDNSQTISFDELSIAKSDSVTPLEEEAVSPE